MRMTRQHFQLIADTINDLTRDGVLSPPEAIMVATRFERVLRETNENFDCSRFYDAATRDLPRIETRMVADLT